MNSDNKFGQCCGCPALMNNSRDLTLWASSRTYNNNMMKKMGTANSNDYRNALQSNAETILKNTLNDYDSNHRCKNSSNNLFYIDSTNFNNLYDSLNAKQVSVPVSDNVNEILSGVDTKFESEQIFNLSLLTSTPMNPKR